MGSGILARTPNERRAYLNAIQDALAGIETARVVLAKAIQRIEADAAVAQVRSNHLVQADDSEQRRAGA
jgi:hypothetical protein